MSDLEQRVKVLETKVQILEETLETLKNMQLSQQMDEYIRSKSKALKLVNLINSVSDEQTLDFSKEEDSIQSVWSEKNAIEQQIAVVLSASGDIPEQYPIDSRFFNYEIETGIMIDDWNKRVKSNDLASYIGKGIRITSYNGFEQTNVIIPEKIDGMPVVSIGEKAFMNAPLTEIILPSSLKVILSEAFNGCKNLKKLDLPYGVVYLGNRCFCDTGLETLGIPNSIKLLSVQCFMGSKYLKVSLPDSIEVIERMCFYDTSIDTIIIPKGTKEVSCEAFGGSYFQRERKVTCVFLGKDTLIKSPNNSTLWNVKQIYCISGSNVQKFAREHNIPMLPLSEFDIKSI